jgi:hypothetical protein
MKTNILISAQVVVKLLLRYSVLFARESKNYICIDQQLVTSLELISLG